MKKAITHWEEVQEAQRQKALMNGGTDDALNVLLALENKEWGDISAQQYALPPIGEMAIEDGTPPGTPPPVEGAIVPVEEDWRNASLDIETDEQRRDRLKKEKEDEAAWKLQLSLQTVKEPEEDEEYPYYFDEVMCQYYDPQSGLYYDPNTQEWYDPYQDEQVAPQKEEEHAPPPAQVKPKSLGTTVSHMRGVKDRQKMQMQASMGGHGHHAHR